MNTRRLTKEELLSAAEKIFGTKPKWHSYIALPAGHSFTTYFESDIEFTGADFCAQFKEYILGIYIYYRNEMLDKDFLKEAEFENAVRSMGHFAKEHGYRAEENLFYTVYNFALKERVREE